MDEDGEEMVQSTDLHANNGVNMHFPAYDPLDFALLNTVTDWPGMITTYQQIECSNHCYHSNGDNGAAIPLGNVVDGGFGSGSGIQDSHCVQSVSVMSDVATTETFKVMKGTPHVVLQLAIRSNDAYIKVVNKYKRLLNGHGHSTDNEDKTETNADADVELLTSEYDDEFVLQYENDMVRYAREGLRYVCSGCIGCMWVYVCVLGILGMYVCVCILDIYIFTYL